MIEVRLADIGNAVFPSLYMMKSNEKSRSVFQPFKFHGEHRAFTESHIQRARNPRRIELDEIAVLLEKRVFEGVMHILPAKQPDAILKRIMRRIGSYVRTDDAPRNI